MPTSRVGVGYDLHRTEPGRRLVLGGVEIPHHAGLVGHSDADVVLHAICDALLGAAALGDIGELFPDSDPKYAGADSRRFIADVLARVNRAGFTVSNVDVVIHAQQPRLTPHKPAIRDSLAELLALPTSAVGVKATTNEGLDAVGRGEAMACWAVVLLATQRS
ncbi:MAG: 2-C-methyl-D-erythritol 2,4-cyclodiphosphate synthase [Planctomycetota bacterium]|nr:MAG: 2-C-methyl-D-erythritol 2,4-cyclodiphosphate synthase [Planctomycetota bacterium]